MDTSVVLAELLAENLRPPSQFWERDDLVSSRLTEYESWVRVHAYGKGASHGATLALLLARVTLVALDDAACARCRAPFPTPVRALDALHLAAADFLRSRGLHVEMATYDARMLQAASAVGFAASAALRS